MNKKIWVFSIIAILLIISIFYSLQILKNMKKSIAPSTQQESGISLEEKRRQEVLNKFSTEEQEKIQKAAYEWGKDGIHEPSEISQFFKSVDDTEKLLGLCEHAIITDTITCYRLLAMDKPEQKEKICNEIDEETCQFYRNPNSCKEKIEDYRFDCIHLFKIVG